MQATKNKPFLILQLRPEDATADNEYEAILKYGGLSRHEAERIRVETDGLPGGLQLEHYAGIIVGGSPFDITTPEEKKSEIQLKVEADFMRLLAQVTQLDFPFLGACSGNGLLGKFLNASLSRQYAEPVGPQKLKITEAGKIDPLLQGFPEEIDVLLGHKEACDAIPPGATLLMTGDQCPVQMFRVGQNVYATQFHPEGDAEGFALRIEIYKNHGYFAAEQAQTLLRKIRQSHTPYAQEILRRFVRLYRDCD